MERIPVFSSSLGGNERPYLIECIDSGRVSSEGPYVRLLERQLATRHIRKYGFAVCNGSAALELAVKALDLHPGDEVILPAFTHIAGAVAVVRAGGRPVLVDSHPDTWNMDVGQIEAKITPRTRAIMAVHIYGLPVDMDPLLALARKHKLRVIEDAAQAMGLRYKDRLCGCHGDVGTFSFSSDQPVTTGEGGMVMFNDDALAARCRTLRNHGHPERRFVHDDLISSMRMSNLQAAVGVAQLERLGATLARKREIAAKYERLLAGWPRLQLPVDATPAASNVYWIYGVVMADEVPIDSHQAVEELGRRGVEARPFFWPMHLQPVFKKMGLFEGESYPVAERLGRRGLYIPAGLDLTVAQMEYVADCVKRLVI
jgi:perosamine synthetase